MFDSAFDPFPMLTRTFFLVAEVNEKLEWRVKTLFVTFDGSTARGRESTLSKRKAGDRSLAIQGFRWKLAWNVLHEVFVASSHVKCLASLKVLENSSLC